MLRHYQAYWRAAFIVCELAITIGVFLASYWIRFLPRTHLSADGSFSVYGLGFLDRYLPPVDPVPAFSAYLAICPALAIGTFVTNAYFGLYRPRRTSSFVDETATVVRSSLMTMLLLLGFFFFDRHFSWSRSVFAIFFVLHPGALIAYRLVVRSALRWLRSRGRNLRHVLVVGTGRPAQELLQRFRRHPWTGIHVVGVITRSASRVGRTLHGHPILATTDDLVTTARNLRIDQVFLALPANDGDVVESLADQLAQEFIAVRIVPDIGYYIAPRELADFDGLPVVSVWEGRSREWDRVTKRALDIVVSATGLVACLPLFAAIGTIIKLGSRGPIIYSQERMGLDGRTFTIFKFRTMRDGAETAAWTTRNDARCTRFGRFLRQTSLDELPQLANVFLGQMSLVGPRPERPVLIEEFRERFPRYMLRHHVKAGMTGWAQVNGWRGDTSLRKRLQYDLYYLRHWSIWFDLKILFLTIGRGLFHRNAH